MDNEGPSMECDECGGTSFHKDGGHFYCNECQTQSQQVQDHVFVREDTPNAKHSRKIQKEKTQKTEDLLTSWECYNYVLKGLVQELVTLGAKPELTRVVRCLWMKYLHKCEVFDINSDRPPKVSVLGPKKDVAILYDVRKRKRRPSRASSVSSNLSLRRKQSAKKRALVNSEYSELSQSQSLTQDSSLLTDALSSLKSGSDTSGSSGKIRYNRYSNTELHRLMSRNHQKKHVKDLSGELTCHKLSSSSFRTSFLKGPTNLTTFTLYSLLYIGLLITGDPIQLGDMLRFIREGHLSFGCFKHFFDDAMSEKALNLSQRKEKLFSHGFFLKRCAKLAQFLDVCHYINHPDLIVLCCRYCEELNLPKEFFECVEKLIVKTNPKMNFEKSSKTIPNYEGRAMSFIVFTMKLLFGFDGVTETKLSVYARALSSAGRMFDILEWLEFIGYRAEVMRLHHLPMALKDCDHVDSDMYLSYLKNQDVKFRGSSRHIHGEVKDYLQVLDKLLENNAKGGGDEITFEPSLTPFVSYTKLILEHKDVPCAPTLTRNFLNHSLEFLLRPNAFLKLLGVQRVKNGGANDNIVTEDLMYLYKSTIFERRKSSSRTVSVKISRDINEDKFIEEYLESEKKQSLRTTDVGVLLSNWQQGNQKEFNENKDLMKAASPNSPIDFELIPNGISYLEHYNPFERYWMNVPTNPVARYFPKHEMDVISAKFPHSFRTILRECTRIVEQDECDFFGELLMTELYLVNFGDFGCKKKKKGKGMFEIRAMLLNCKKHW